MVMQVADLSFYNKWWYFIQAYQFLRETFFLAP